MLRHTSVRRAALCAVSTIALGFTLQAAPAFAADSTTTAQSTTIGELVITAGKREENLQDVPVAVTAYTGDMRDKTGLVSAQDQMNFTPGVQYSPGADRITIRGVGRVTGQIGTDQGVAVYQDGYYVGSAGGLNASSLGIERTEVLRGPQGTLYGRNSVGGAVNIISRRPDNEYTGEMRASINSFEGTVFEGRVSGPIWGDKLRASFQFNVFNQTEGYYHDTLPPPSAGSVPGGPNGAGPLLNTATVQPVTYESIKDMPEEGGVGHGWTANIQLAYESDNFDAWIRYVTLDHFTRPRDSTGISEWSLLPLIVPNVFTGFLPDQNPGIYDHRAYYANRPTDNKLHDFHQVIGEAVWHASGFDVKYVGGYYHTETNNRIDGDATGDPNFRTPGLFGGTVIARNDIAYRTDYWLRSTSHEINITSTNDSPLQWIAGAYFYDEHSTVVFDVPNYQEPHFDQLTDYLFGPGNFFTAGLQAAIGPVPSGPRLNPEDLLYYYTADLRTRSTALFAQFDYRPNDQWHFVAGFRYSWDRKKGYESQYSITQIVLADQATATGLDATLNALTGGLVRWPRYPSDHAFAGQFVMDYVFMGCSSAGTPAAVAQGIVSVNPAVGPCPGERNLKDSWSAPTGTLAVEYAPNDDTNLYLRYSRGYKSGGYNLGTLATGAIVGKETIDAFEGGWKQNVGDRLRFNTAIYYYLYDGLQTLNSTLVQENPPIIVNQLVNLDKSRSYGLEFEGQWSPIDNLLLMFNYGYINNKVVRGCCFVDSSDPTAIQPGAQPVGTTGAQSLVGNRLPQSPKHKISANITYTFNWDPGSLSVSVIESWHSSFYNSLFNNPHWFVRDGAETSARVVWTGASKKYEIIASVSNLFNKEIWTAFTTLPPNQNFYRLLSLQPPRVFTLEARYHF